MAFRFRVRDIHARLSEGVRRPDIGKRAAPAVQYQETGILCIPTIERVRIATVGVVVRIHAAAVRIVGSMTSEKAHIIHKGVFARYPHHSSRPAVNAAGIQTYPRYN